MRCAACGTDNEPGRKFCGGCGAKLEVACPACGSRNTAGIKFCGECGSALTDVATTVASIERLKAKPWLERLDTTGVLEAAGSDA